MTRKSSRAVTVEPKKTTCNPSPGCVELGRSKIWSEDEIGEEYNQPQLDDEAFEDVEVNLPNRYLERWYLFRRQDALGAASSHYESIWTPRCPLPDDLGMSGKGYVLRGWLQLAPSMLPQPQQARLVEITGIEQWFIDRSSKERGYWIQSKMALYRLRNASSIRGRTKIKLTGKGVTTVDTKDYLTATFPSPQSQEDLHWRLRAKLGLVSNLIDLFSSDVASVHMQKTVEDLHKSLGKTSRDGGPFDMELLRSSANFVSAQLESLFDEKKWTESKFLRSLATLKSSKVWTNSDYQESSMRAEMWSTTIFDGAIASAGASSSLNLQEQQHEDIGQEDHLEGGGSLNVEDEDDTNDQVQMPFSAVNKKDLGEQDKRRTLAPKSPNKGRLKRAKADFSDDEDGDAFSEPAAAKTQKRRLSEDDTHSSSIVVKLPLPSSPKPAKPKKAISLSSYIAPQTGAAKMAAEPIRRPSTNATSPDLPAEARPLQPASVAEIKIARKAAPTVPPTSAPISLTAETAKNRRISTLLKLAQLRHLPGGGPPSNVYSNPGLATARKNDWQFFSGNAPPSFPGSGPQGGGAALNQPASNNPQATVGRGTGAFLPGATSSDIETTIASNVATTSGYNASQTQGSSFRQVVSQGDVVIATNPQARDQMYPPPACANVVGVQEHAYNGENRRRRPGFGGFPERQNMMVSSWLTSGGASGNVSVTPYSNPRAGAQGIADARRETPAHDSKQAAIGRQRAGGEAQPEGQTILTERRYPQDAPSRARSHDYNQVSLGSRSNVSQQAETRDTRQPGRGYPHQNTIAPVSGWSHSQSTVANHSLASSFQSVRLPENHSGLNSGQATGFGLAPDAYHGQVNGPGLSGGPTNGHGRGRGKEVNLPAWMTRQT